MPAVNVVEPTRSNQDFIDMQREIASLRKQLGDSKMETIQARRAENEARRAEDEARKAKNETGKDYLDVKRRAAFLERQLDEAKTEAIQLKSWRNEDGKMVDKSWKGRQGAIKSLRHALTGAMMDWAVFARIALGRALGDVRAYILNPVRAKLLPPKKKGVIETTASSSYAVKEIEKTSSDEF